jgi:metal-dependent amidase/aminoacylase/carboxypeptidase family protein
MPVQDEILRAIDAAAERVIEVSRLIHAHPELRFQEHFAAKTLGSALEAFGIAVQQPTGAWTPPCVRSSAARLSRRWRFSRNMTRCQTAMPVGIISSLVPLSARP